MNRKKILITGGAGMVGNAFRRIATTYPDYEFVFVTRQDFDLTSEVAVFNLFNTHRPDWVIHAAGVVGGVKYNSEFPDLLFYNNIMMNTLVLNTAKTFNVSKLVAFISTCSFPADVVKLEENCLHLGPPHHTNTSYACTKRAIDIQIQSYRKLYDLDYYSIIPSNLYGIEDNFDIEAGHVVPALINKCHRAVNTNSPLVIWGDGSQVREFLFVDDLAKATMRIMQTKHQFDKIIVSDSKPLSIKTLANNIADSFQLPKERLLFDTSKPSGLHKRCCNTRLFRFLLHDFVFTGHKQGVDLTVKWFAAKHPNIRGL